MIVELKFNIDALHLLSSILGSVYKREPTTDYLPKEIISICYDLADKFEKKYKTQQKKPTLFDTKKKYKVSLKYHEGWALLKVVNYSLPLTDTPFHRAVLTKIQLQLDPKIK